MKQNGYTIVWVIMIFCLCCVIVVNLLSHLTVQAGDAQSSRQTADITNPMRQTPPFLKLFIRDWNWWENAPHMFSIPQGNIGIGTKYPHATLDVFGNIAIQGKEIISSSGTWVGEIAGLQGPQGPPGDSRWELNGTNISYTTGSVGIGLFSSLAKFQVYDGAVLFNGEIGGTPISGTGTRLMWVPSKAAIRAGSTYGNLWDDINIGSHSVAMGFSTKASVYGSTAFGAYTTASGMLSTAMGEYTTATGYGSTALGVESLTTGFASTATGFLTKANGQASTAMGNSTMAQGDSSTALGRSTVAHGAGSTAIGTSIVVNGVYSMGIGLMDHWPLYQVNQSNVLSVMGGVVGIGTTHPEATLEVDGTMKVLGAWQENLTYNEVYAAETDGFVSVVLSLTGSDGDGAVFGFTDEKNPPTSLRGSASVSSYGSQGGTYTNSFLMPIRNGDYWQITYDGHPFQCCDIRISWIPLGI